MNKGIQLLREAIKKGKLEYFRQTGSYAYVAEYEDGELKIVYNSYSAREARSGDFEIIAKAKWHEGQGYPHWVIAACDNEDDYEIIPEYED